MKIIFDARVLTHTNYTGVEIYAKNILERLSKEIDIYIAKPKQKNKYLAHLWSHFKLAFKKGDILFCPANVAPFFVPKDKKLVVTLHDVAYITHPTSFSFLFRTYYRWLMPIVLKRSDKILTVSNFSKKEIIKYYPDSSKKIEVVHLAVNEEYRIDKSVNKEKIILYVGSLNERKNFSSVIQAYELLKRDDYKLLIIGNFSSNFSINHQTDIVLQRAKLNKNILFKSNVLEDELIILYNKAALLLFPSFYEGFGLPPLESMACGTPVITSNITAMPEICAEAAIYVNPSNIEDIKEKITLLLEDKELYEEMRMKGLQKVQEYTWNQTVMKHIKVFKEVIQ